MIKYIIFAFSLVIFQIASIGFNHNLLKITFCDVGQGDATLLSIGSIQVLIDAGPNDKILDCLEHQMPFWDKKIEFLVLTHMDRDHIGGAPQVMEYYSIDYVFMNPSNKKTSDFSVLEQVVLSKTRGKTKLITTFVGQNLRINHGFNVQVISPLVDFTQVEGLKNSMTETTLSDATRVDVLKKLAETSENNLSIALFVTFGDVSFLLPGDLEAEGELALLPTGLLNKVVILKAGHHGSKSSSTPGFVKILEPEITVISSGKNNAYNHPSPQVVELFSKLGIDIYQTKNSGELSFVTDGQKFWETKAFRIW